jgi:hypothetical protein
MPLQRTRLVLRGETCRCSEQQKQAGKPCHHLDFPAFGCRSGHAGGDRQAGILRTIDGEEWPQARGCRLDRATVAYRSSSATRVTTWPHCWHRKDVSSGCGPTRGSLRCNFIIPPHASQRGGTNWLLGKGCILLPFEPPAAVPVHCRFTPAVSSMVSMRLRA